MWEYPKSRAHQAAIDKLKPELDRTAAKARAAELKLRRDDAGQKALKDHEANKVAVLAKTTRLRAERLARAAETTINGTDLKRR